MDTDRNLLFGVLALQADLIESRQFIEACLLWTSRKDVPMADLLIERGWIVPADREHVDYLLARKLQRHGGDPRASLAAVPDEVKRSLAALDDDRIRRALVESPQSEEAADQIATLDFVRGASERYTRLRLHATGGIGRVWLAHDGDLGRDVALKELRPETAEQATFAARFLQEARITGQLEHPGVIPVYELACPRDDRQPFYTMRFVKGRTLREAARDYHQKRMAGQADALGLPTLLNAFVTVCNTVAYAHSRGVIHRDLKGQNVILGDFGEVVVLDWGLAKLIGRPEDAPEASLVVLDAAGADSGYTVQGQALGTPAYMAPEQAAGQLDKIDRRTDVYGLGAILYEILTGVPPVTGSGMEEVLRKVQEEGPIPPRQLWPEAPAALEALCLRALAKRPEDRPAAAAELGREVQGWQEFERRKIQERFELAVQGSQDGLWDWDVEADQIWYSPRLRAMFGYDEQEFPNRPGETEKRVHPDDHPRWRAALHGHVTGLTDHLEMEYRIRHKDGSYRWVRNRGVALRRADGKAYRMAGSSEDITERKRAEEALRESEERYRSVIAAMQDGILLLDADGRFRSCNAAAERILGLSAEQIMGRTPHDPRWQAIQEDGAPVPGDTNPALVTLRTGKPCTDKIMGVHKADGTLTWITVNAQPLFQADGRTLAGVAASFEDITDRKAADEALVRTAEQLECCEQRLQQLAASDERGVPRTDAATE